MKMKKIVLAILFLACAVALLPAQGYSYFGVGAGYTGQQITASSTFDLVNINLQFGSFYGATVGILTTATIGTNVLATWGGTSFNLSGYDMNYVMDAVMGLGFRIPAPKSMVLIVGAGVYFGAIFIESFDYYSSTVSDVAMTLGPGASANFGFRLASNLFLNANVTAGYGMFDPIGLGDYSGNGLRVSGGVGLGIGY
jgi:hypothetical protein